MAEVYGSLMREWQGKDFQVTLEGDITIGGVTAVHSSSAPWHFTARGPSLKTHRCLELRGQAQLHLGPLLAASGQGQDEQGLADVLAMLRAPGATCLGWATASSCICYSLTLFWVPLENTLLFLFTG